MLIFLFSLRRHKMVNQLGRPLPNRPREGTVLTAEQLRLIVDMSVKRITGGKGINVKAMGRGQIVIEDSGL